MFFFHCLFRKKNKKHKLLSQSSPYIILLFPAMHHHYLSRAPWNADTEHVGGLRSWIIFGLQPKGICVESSPHCFLLLRTLGTNIYQSTNYWAHVCPGTCKHCLPRGLCMCAHSCWTVYCLQYVSGSILPPNMWWREDPWETGLLLRANVCWSRSVMDIPVRKEAVGNGTFITWTLTLTSRQAAGQIDAKEGRVFPLTT